MVKYDSLKIASALAELYASLRILDWHPTGSGYATGEGNDIDAVVLVKDRPPLGYSCLVEAGWVPCAGGYAIESAAAPDFEAFRKGDVNLIVVHDYDHYEKWISASEVCRYLQLATKAQRVAVHRIIVYEEFASDQA